LYAGFSNDNAEIKGNRKVVNKIGPKC